MIIGVAFVLLHGLTVVLVALVAGGCVESCLVKRRVTGGTLDENCRCRGALLKGRGSAEKKAYVCSRSGRVAGTKGVPKLQTVVHVYEQLG